MLNTDPLLLIIGVIAVFTGLLLIMLSFLTEGESGEERKSEAGGAIIIGPFPIIFGSSRSAAITAAIIGIIFTALAIALTLLLEGGNL